MPAANNRDPLCREWEALADVLHDLFRERKANSPGDAGSERAITEGIVATERKMMRISRELIDGLIPEDSVDVDDYVNALYNSKCRTQLFSATEEL